MSTFLIALCFIFTSDQVKAQTSFTVDTASGCDSLLVTFTNTSSIGDFWFWDFDDGGTYFGTPLFPYTSIGIWNIPRKLKKLSIA